MAEIIVDIGDNLVETIGCEFKGELVRCKECKHWTKWSDGEMFCGRLDGGIGTDADDYCSYGERKEDGKDIQSADER